MKKLGLVFAGGGGKGAYEIGVWKALKEFGVDQNIAVVSGTSVGGLNAALLMAGSYEIAAEIWLSIRPDQILKKTPATFIKAILINTFLSITPAFLNALIPTLLSDGIFSREGLLEIIDSRLDLDAVSNSGVTGYVACCPVDKFLSDVKYIKLNQMAPELIRKYLLATSAIPGIFPIEKIDDSYYVDGGTRGFVYGKCCREGFDNIPILPLLSEDCDYAIVVHLSAASIIRKESFPNLQILEIFPSQNLGGICDGILDFSAAGARKRLNLGYADAVKILQPFYETVLIQSKVNQSNRRLCYELDQVNREIDSILAEGGKIRNCSRRDLKCKAEGE